MRDGYHSSFYQHINKCLVKCFQSIKSLLLKAVVPPIKKKKKKFSTGDDFTKLLIMELWKEVTKNIPLCLSLQHKSMETYPKKLKRWLVTLLSSYQQVGDSNNKSQSYFIFEKLIDHDDVFTWDQLEWPWENVTKPPKSPPIIFPKSNPPISNLVIGVGYEVILRCHYTIPNAHPVWTRKIPRVPIRITCSVLIANDLSLLSQILRTKMPQPFPEWDFVYQPLVSKVKVLKWFGLKTHFHFIKWNFFLPHSLISKSFYEFLNSFNNPRRYFKSIHEVYRETSQSTQYQSNLPALREVPSLSRCQPFCHSFTH